MEFLIAAALAIIVLLFLLGGAIQTFRRNVIVAVLMFVFLNPVWMLWALVECFMPDPRTQVHG